MQIKLVHSWRLTLRSHHTFIERSWRTWNFTGEQPRVGSVVEEAEGGVRHYNGWVQWWKSLRAVCAITMGGFSGGRA